MLKNVNVPVINKRLLTKNQRTAFNSSNCDRNELTCFTIRIGEAKTRQKKRPFQEPRSHQIC